MKKKRIAVLLIAAMLFSMLPAAAFAEIHPNVENEARIGDQTFRTLSEALSRAEDGDDIYLLRDVTLDQPAEGHPGYGLFLDKSVNIHGEDYVIRNGLPGGIGVAAQNVTITDVKIFNNSDDGTGIELLGDRMKLTLNNMVIDCVGDGTNQSLVINSPAKQKTKVFLTDTFLGAGDEGYGITALSPAEISIKSSTVKALCAICYRGSKRPGQTTAGTSGADFSRLWAEGSRFVSNKTQSAEADGKTAAILHENVECIKSEFTDCDFCIDSPESEVHSLTAFSGNEKTAQNKVVLKGTDSILDVGEGNSVSAGMDALEDEKGNRIEIRGGHSNIDPSPYVPEGYRVTEGTFEGYDYDVVASKPDRPVFPDRPIFPDIPDGPVFPDRPIFPDIPGIPDRPIGPITPITPSTPSTPVTPAPPAEPVQPIRVSTPEPDMTVSAGSVSDDVLEAAQKALEGDSRFRIVGDGTTAVQIRAMKNGQSVTELTQPVTVSIPVTGDLLKNVKDPAHLTLAQVVTDAKGRTTLEYVGGSYDAKTGLFTAKVDNAGNYVLVEKDHVMKIVLTIDSMQTLVNDAAGQIDVAPIIEKDRTMVPLRFIGESLDCDVDWDEATRSIIITQYEKELKMTVGEEIPGFGAAPIIRNDRTLVPIRYVSEALGANVIYDPFLRQVIIVK